MPGVKRIVVRGASATQTSGRLRYLGQ